MTTTPETATRDGVDNLIRNCLAVASGETVLLLNGHTEVERDLVGLMEEAINDAGGTPYSLWVDKLDIGLTEVPGLIRNAIDGADKLLLNANLNRVILFDHLKATDRTGLVRVNNRTRQADRIGSEHARFHWGLVMALAHRVEELTASAKTYHVTTPHGTDISGSIVSQSDVADAFFAQDADDDRSERVFPGEVYAPVPSAGANGVLAFDHSGLLDKDRWPNPMTFTIEDNMLTGMEWTEGVKRGDPDPGTQTIWSLEHFQQLLDKNVAQHGADKANILDSWHGGMHPKAEKRSGQLSETKTMHFHIGRITDTLSVYMSDQSITLDETPMFINGELALLKEPAIQDLARGYGQKI